MCSDGRSIVTRSGTAISIKGVTSVSRWKQKTTSTRSFATWSGTPCVQTSWSERNRGAGRVCAVWSAKTRRSPSSRRGLCLAPPIGCNLSTSRKRKPKRRRCGAASSAVGPSAIPTGSRTRPSDWGWNGRFGFVEDRRNNHKACHNYLYSRDLVAVTFTVPQVDRKDDDAPQHLKADQQLAAHRVDRLFGAAYHLNSPNGWGSTGASRSCTSRWTARRAEQAGLGDCDLTTLFGPSRLRLSLSRVGSVGMGRQKGRLPPRSERCPRRARCPRRGCGRGGPGQFSSVS